MNATMVLSLMGGLGLFLFGIKTMGDGLETAAGNRMKHLLEILTRNKLTAVLIGAFITAVIQSSSATTVMVVGFVNAGLLQLSQAIGVIMGANIGTTITSLMLSVEIDFAIIFTAVGAVLQLAGNRPAVKLGGQIAMGLGMLFLGMDMMSSAMEPLRDWKGFQDMMVYAANPVVGVLVGALVTALLQSSAASIGILQSLAAAGAARLLLTGHAPESVALRTPKGIVVEVAPLYCRPAGAGAECAIEKDGGDDVDVTTGLPVIAAVELLPDTTEIRISGGKGVGRVTKAGLDQPVGEAAINHVPRQMIAEALQREAESACYTGGFAVTISIEGGEEVAKRTFNPHIGVEGGLSVLGTSGIVEPMSQQAILDTIQLEMNQAALRAGSPRRLILAPGNYGLDYLHERYPEFHAVPVVKTSNFIGDTLDMAAAARFEEVLLVGHVGKLVKVAGGIMNTHSHTADCRTELFCTHAALCGASREVCAALMDAATTDACLELLDSAGLRAPVLESLLRAVQLHLDRRACGAFRVGAVLFSNQHGPLGATDTAAQLLNEWKEH